MSDSLKILLLMLLGGVLCSANMAAQNDSIRWQDFSFIKQSDIRLTGYNAAGMKHLPIDYISSAAINATKQNGDFINYHQSEDNYTLGAQVESFYRLNPQIVFYGKVSYNYFEGKNMGGSAFINPYDNPFDIVEFADTTRGNKELENYHLTGAISADVYKGLTLGAKVDYRAANYAKTKDLRHKNKLMDLQATAGASYPLSKSVEIGANYYYRRTTEELTFKAYGTTDRIYTPLISYGAFFGVLETYQENAGQGYTQAGRSNPMFNEFHGGSLQANVHLNNGISFLNEATYKSRDGYYGRKSSSTIVYSEHSARIWEYRGMLSFAQKRNKHVLEVNIDNEQLDNYENIYEKQTVPGEGSTSIIVYHGNLKVGDKETFNARAQYTGYLGIEDYNPAWVVSAGAQFWQRRQTASLYPYYRKQTIRYTRFNLQAERNIVNGLNMYSFLLGASYQTGSGTPKNDGLYATPSETTPKSSDLNLYREYEYLTNNQIRSDIGFRYSRLLKHIGVKGYASLRYSLSKASDVQYLNGDKLNELTFSVGCTF
ncbi:DUF6850 family outer membrane beta-barrel protein [Dysgonomonas sp. 25]|uniref:DUF6850 family outer membrane beta-barrel protein n=1 Tax=Dysgonomonas sp. 25 TaxID=2302933 RepID=UPI0013D31996|nr:DUF6850 family outer membrane beta-barrel protein [Dysgonomonas sp. 25]NDV68503.1 hypothetical protein [Dysgonomonas sp. 25]